MHIAVSLMLSVSRRMLQFKFAMVHQKEDRIEATNSQPLIDFSR